MKKTDTKKAAPAKAPVKKTATAKAPVKKQTAKKKMAIGGFASDFAQGQAFTGNPEAPQSMPFRPDVVGTNTNSVPQTTYTSFKPQTQPEITPNLYTPAVRNYNAQQQVNMPNKPRLADGLRKAARDSRQGRSAPSALFGTGSGLRPLPSDNVSQAAENAFMQQMRQSSGFAKGGLAKKKPAKGGAVKKSTKGKK